MKIRVIRGTHCIGGAVTEYSTATTRICIDFGSELPDRYGKEKTDTLDIPGLTKEGDRCDAVFFTHTHGDHIGQMKRILPGIPLYLGIHAKWILLNRKSEIDREEQQNASGTASQFEDYCHWFKENEPIQIGDIKITAFYVDHSAFDAYMFLIEADGKRVLHTGDFRTHGFRGNKLIPMLKAYVGKVDWVVTEGTNITGSDRPSRTERQLQYDLKKIMNSYKKVFVICASTNIDRIAGFSHAVEDGRPIFCDGYQKTLLLIAKENCQKPSKLYSFRNIMVFRPNDSKLMETVKDKGFLFFIRGNKYGKRLLEKYGNDAMIVYSMWTGYLAEEYGNDVLREMLADRTWTVLHTSGHAGRKELKEVIDAVSPSDGVIPVHTSQPEAFKNLLADYKVDVLDDGETLHTGLFMLDGVSLNDFSEIFEGK